MNLKKKYHRLQEKNRSIILDAQKQPLELLNKYFPKGSKKRGEAMALLAVTFWEAYDAGKRVK